MFNFLILGLGPFVANFVWPQLGTIFKQADHVVFSKLFLVPSATALAAAIFLAIFFRPPAKNQPQMTGQPATAH